MLTLVTLALGAALLSETPRNIIIVMTDDQGYGDLACHGNPVLKTPNLDKLHSQSVRLTDFHVSPTCAPTRSAPYFFSICTSSIESKTVLVANFILMCTHEPDHLSVEHHFY